MAADYKEINIFGVDPGTFAYDAENPTKYTEALSHTLSKNLFNAQEAGMVWSQGIHPEILRLVKEGLQALIDYNKALKDAYDAQQATRGIGSRGLPAVIPVFLPLILRVGSFLMRIWAVVRVIGWEAVSIEAAFQLARWMIERQYTTQPGTMDITPLIDKIDEILGNIDGETFDKNAVPDLIRRAVEDLVLKDSVVRLGDNCTFHQKAELLEY